MKEKYKDIKDFEGLYKISNFGNVLCCRKNTILKTYKSNWYTSANLRKNGKQFSYKVHRLVALCFLKNPNNYEQINHINGIKGDNRLKNLEWCSRSQNVKHAHASGLINIKNKTSIFKGVSLINRKYPLKKKWRAGITINGRFLCLGYFLTEGEAGERYIQEINKK